MNRKIMLLPLAATVMCGLISCGNGGATTSTTSETTSSVPAVYDGNISTLEVGDAAVSGIVAAKTTKGWVLDDGKASVYVYGALDKFKVGDHVNVAATCTGYWGLYELTSANVTANTKVGPTLADPTEITAAEINTAWNALKDKSKDDATWAPTNSKRYKITGLTAEDVSGYAGWSIEGFENKLSPYYYDAASNVTEANRGTKLYSGCKYDVSFYIIGTNSSKNINMGIFDVTAHFDPVTSVAITGDASVEVGSSVTLTSTVSPATADQGVIWTSSDETIATVSSSGDVTGVAEGSVKITATSTADNTKKVEWDMTVSKATVNYAKVGALSFNQDTTVDIDNKLDDATDPYITYTSTEGVAITVRKNTSKSDVNVWKNTYSSCRWYVGHKADISHNSPFSRVILTCDSDYATFANSGKEVVLPEGATYKEADNVITVTLASPVTSLSIVPVKQLRPSNIELQAVAAAE